MTDIPRNGDFTACFECGVYTGAGVSLSDFCEDIHGHKIYPYKKEDSVPDKLDKKGGDE